MVCGVMWRGASSCCHAQLQWDAGGTVLTKASGAEGYVSCVVPPGGGGGRRPVISLGFEGDAVEVLPFSPSGAYP
jgi:hypothetical protein